MLKKGGAVVVVDVTVVHKTNKADLLEEECNDKVLKYMLLIQSLKAINRTVKVMKIPGFPPNGTHAMKK